MKQVLNHYENYPASSEYFMKWYGKTEDLIYQVKTSLNN
jgi:hypothetical protein